MIKSVIFFVGFLLNHWSKIANFDRGLRRKLTTMITHLINFRHFYLIFSTIFHEPDVKEIRVIPQNFCRWKSLQWRYHPFPTKTLDGEDTEARRECRKLNFELHGNVIYQNFRLWKTNLMVPKSTIFDQLLRRKPTIKITLLINFWSFLFHIFYLFSWTRSNRNTCNT